MCVSFPTRKTPAGSTMRLKGPYPSDTRSVEARPGTTRLDDAMVMIDRPAPSIPAGLGPYSPFVRAGGLIFVSAQVGVDQRTRKAPRAFQQECQQAFENLVRAVAAAGAETSDIVKTTVLFTNEDHFNVVNDVFANVFPNSPPARTIAVVGLPRGVRIAVDAIAVARPSS